MTLATTSPCLTTRCTYTPSLRLKDGRRMTYHCYRQPNKLSRSHRATSFVFAFPEFIRGLKRSDRIGNNIYWSSYVHTNSSPRPARRFCTNLVLLLCSSLRLFFDNPSILIHRSSSFNARLSRVCSAPSSLFGHSVTHGSLDTQTSEDYEIEGKKRRKRDSKHASEDVEKESRKKKRRISWERKGEVPDEPLEGVVAKRAGKLPTARTEKRMRSKPPRLSS
ncbi:methyltransferase, partial [Cystoisospora suis]